MKIFLFIFLLFAVCLKTYGQERLQNGADTLTTQTPAAWPENRLVKIDRILIVGNKITRDRIILREVDVLEGEWYGLKELREILEEDRNKIFNTRLFTTVKISIAELNRQEVDIIIKVLERWYTFPVPIFKLADRNFNDWWVNQERDLSRVEYGLKFYQYNMRGRNERLKLLAQFGFTKTFELAYNFPYIDRAQINGLSFRVNYSENTNVAYATEEEKFVFLDSEEILRDETNFIVQYTHRPSFYNFHTVDLQYRRSSVADTVLSINPRYFPDGKNEIEYFFLSYGFRRDLRDMRNYPLTGSFFDTELRKLGLGIFNDLDLWEFLAAYTKFWNLGNDFFFSNDVNVQTSFPRNQPFIQQRALGFGQDYIRGFDLYVIDGQHSFLNKSTLRFRVLEGEKNLGKLMPVEQFRIIPVAIYLKAFIDQGFVSNTFPDQEPGRFNNRYLGGAGVGVDIVTFYDAVWRFEFAANQFGETGFFINFKADF